MLKMYLQEMLTFLLLYTLAILATVRQRQIVNIWADNFKTYVTAISKALALYYKRLVLGQLIDELAVIWPMPPLDIEAENLKRKKLARLYVAHICKKIMFYQ